MAGSATDARPALRVYAKVRTAHLERFAVMAPATVIYHGNRYDFDASLRVDRAPLQRLGRVATLWHLLRRGYRVVEVNEPIMFERWLDLIALLLVIRLRDLVTRRHTDIVTYCIGLTDPPLALHLRRRLPIAPLRLVTSLVMRLLVVGMDRIAFGTAGCRDLYAGYVGERALAGKARTFEAVPGRCDCVDAADPDAERSAGTVLFVGAFDDRKGIEQTMQAWDELSTREPSLRFHVIGKGPREDDVRAWAADRPQVQLEIDPPRSEIHAALRRADVLVLLSQRIGAWREQVGLPIVEALGHGVTVVTTGETGLASWLGHHGHPVLDPGASASAVAAAISKALSSRRPAELVLADLPAEDRRIAADFWLMSPDGAAR